MLDTKRALDFTNNWRIGGCIRYIDVRQHFQNKLKEEVFRRTDHVPCEENDADLFTKNLLMFTFEKHK